LRDDPYITLPDGRALAYAEFGRPDGRPVLYFHGSPSCRLEPTLIGDETLFRLGVRMIAPDRPGIGRSTYQRQRGFVDWPDDVGALADSLGWDRFSVLGNSGGAAYVAACAALIPERLTAAVIVSGAWRMDAPQVAENLPLANRLVWKMARYFPPGLQWLLRSMTRAGSKSTDAELSDMKRFMPAADVAAFAQAGRLECMQAAIRECLRQGTRGAAWDMRLYVRPFGFPMSDIGIPLRLFHGGEDRNVPIALVRSVVPLIPRAQLTVFPDDAHLSTLCNHIEEILAAAK